jgi:hypothetical protein
MLHQSAELSEMPKELVTLRVSLESGIYRDIEISGEASLYKLAEVINNVFGFDFDHAFGFYDNLKDTYKSKVMYELFTDMGEEPTKGAKGVKKSRVADAFEKEGKKMAFMFDYGDEWLFEVKRLKGREADSPKEFWRMIKSVGDAPEQYPSFEEEDDGDGRSFDEKYEMVDMGGIKVARLREKK